jgi:quercetin dioxygenase-like cupin family protein
MMGEPAKKLTRDVVIRLSDVQPFEAPGIVIYGLATPSKGARQIELWMQRSQPETETPIHSHSAEEVIVVLRGRGEVRRIGKETTTFEAPCALILSSHELHQIANAGREVLELIAAVPVGSKVFDERGVEMMLPWRE